MFTSGFLGVTHSWPLFLIPPAAVKGICLSIRGTCLFIGVPVWSSHTRPQAKLSTILLLNQAGCDGSHLAAAPSQPLVSTSPLTLFMLEESWRLTLIYGPT